MKDKQLTFAKWGLVPSWAKDSKIGYAVINARAETVADKPTFRSAFKKGRCLVLADGFYEWNKVGDKKQPYYITRKRIGSEVFDEVFRFVLTIAEEKRLLAGKTVGVDSTTLEANAAMKSIVRRDTGEDWRQYVLRLMREDGTIEPEEV